MRQALLTAFVLLVPVYLYGQALSGRWEGNYYGGFLVMNPNKVVVDLMVQDSVVTGSSHLYYSGDRYEHYYLNGWYRAADSTIYFSEDGVIAVNIGNTCLGNYTMRLATRAGRMRLDGRWKDNSKAFLPCPSTNVWFEKPLPEQPAPAAVAAVKDKNLERKPDLQELIEIAQDEKDSISIELLDNAQIDNDVVSVYVNDSLVLHKVKLRADPSAFRISLSRSMQICRIKMAAESMGSVPPCTALMVVATSRNRYEVTLSSNFGNNGTLELFLKD